MLYFIQVRQLIIWVVNNWQDIFLRMLIYSLNEYIYINELHYIITNAPLSSSF